MFSRSHFLGSVLCHEQANQANPQKWQQKMRSKTNTCNQDKNINQNQNSNNKNTSNNKNNRMQQKITTKQKQL